MDIKLETKRLTLQTIDSSIAELYFDFLVRNADFFKKWSPVYEDEYFDLEYHKKRVVDMERDINEGRLIKFGIFLKPDLNRIIGTVAFSNIVGGPFQSCYLGYRLDEKENGKGYVTEAIRAGIDFVFSEMKLHRIEANIVPYNSASIKVAESLGFTLEGCSKHYLQINGKWEDHLHYVLLNE